MRKLTAILCAATMAFSLPIAAPAVAMPIAAPAVGGSANMANQNIVDVQYRSGRRHYRSGRHYGPRGGRPHVRYRSGRPYYGRHRGYRAARPGYRRHGGYWFPPAAFAAGAILGGAIASQPPVRYRPRGNPHVQWCYDRYRSYRASDNTFQPYNGPRRQCRSPYG